jgi:hypothetical protein
LSTSTPSRLLCRRGRWALELTRLVPVDNHVFQPRRQRLEGSEAILSHLKRTGDSVGLAQAAAQLMRAVRSDEERTFEAVDGEWVPSQAMRAAEGVNESWSPPRQNLADALAELRAEVLLLRASHHRLKERVASLESQLLGGGAPAPKPERPRTAAVSLTPAGRARAAEPAPVPMPASVAKAAPAPARDHTLATGRDPEPAAEPAAAPAATPPSIANRVGGVAPARDQVAAPQVSIALGEQGDVLEALKDLFGGDPGFAISKEPLPDSALELAALYACILVDDDGNEVGAVLADIRATANLGGKLAGLPTSLIEEQSKTGVLSETVTAAMSEVCNTLSGVMSRVPGNCNVRATPLESFPADRLRWVGTARSCVALEKRRCGAFWIVTR